MSDKHNPFPYAQLGHTDTIGTGYRFWICHQSGEFLSRSGSKHGRTGLPMYYTAVCSFDRLARNTRFLEMTADHLILEKGSSL